MTNAESVARTLAERGVEFAFGIPGGEIVMLIEACRRAGIQFLLTGHEASAAFMADVTGQISGRPGVCFATLGPGAVNLTLGLANALLDRSPVLALTGQVPATIEPEFPHQRLPLTRILGGVCKWSGVIDGLGTEELVERCVEFTIAAPYGPVHLALPSDVATQQARNGTPRQTPEWSDVELAGRELTEIAELLEESARALIVVGLGCRKLDCATLRRFVDETGIPFVATPKAKGCLPETHAGFLGVVGGMAMDGVIQETLEQADLLLGVGFDPVECDKAWYVRRHVVNLTRVPTAEGRYRPIECVGDIEESLRGLMGRGLRLSWPNELLAERKRRLRPRQLTNGGGVSPMLALERMREALPAEAIMSCDVGSHKYFVGQFWTTHQPQTFFMSNGLSAMGYGVPAAIAAKLHFPQRPAVAVVGDGGLLMMMHNLVFMRQYKVPVVVVCFVDGSLSLIRVGQERRGLEPYGVDFPAPEFAKIAQAFGLRGVHVKSADELQQAVDAMVRVNEAGVISVPIDMAEYQAYA